MLMTEPAPITEFRPTVTSGQIVTPPPMHTLLPRALSWMMASPDSAPAKVTTSEPAGVSTSPTVNAIGPGPSAG